MPSPRPPTRRLSARMGGKAARRLLLGAAALAIASALVVFVDRAPSESEIPAAAHVDERYSHLLHRIHVPEDAGNFGAFSDYGWWSGTSYAGEDDLTPGFWVYVAPHWYVWRDREERYEDRDPPDAEALTRASVDGKYARFLRRIEVPRDEKRNGKFKDYGWWDGKEWGGYEDLPPGYWVWIAPHWYIWKERR